MRNFFKRSAAKSNKIIDWSVVEKVIKEAVHAVKPNIDKAYENSYCAYINLDARVEHVTILRKVASELENKLCQGNRDTEEGKEISQYIRTHIGDINKKIYKAVAADSEPYKYKHFGTELDIVKCFLSDVAGGFFNPESVRAIAANLADKGYYVPKYVINSLKDNPHFLEIEEEFAVVNHNWELIESKRTIENIERIIKQEFNSKLQDNLRYSFIKLKNDFKNSIGVLKAPYDDTENQKLIDTLVILNLVEVVNKDMKLYYEKRASEMVKGPAIEEIARYKDKLKAECYHSITEAIKDGADVERLKKYLSSNESSDASKVLTLLKDFEPNEEVVDYNTDLIEDSFGIPIPKDYDTTAVLVNVDLEVKS